MFFRYVGENAEVCRVLLGDGASPALIRVIIETGTRDVPRKNATLERQDKPVPAEIAAHHLVAASIALLRW